MTGSRKAQVQHLEGLLQAVTLRQLGYAKGRAPRRQIIRAARAERAGLVYATDSDLVELTAWYTQRLTEGTDPA